MVAFAHCHRHDAERARDAAREVDEIASPFSARRKPLRSSGPERGAWSPSRIVTGTMRSARETPRAKSTRSRALSARRKPLRSSGLERGAWVAFAHCHRHDAERARDAAREVDEIASPFGQAQALEVERAPSVAHWSPSRILNGMMQTARLTPREKSTRSRARLAKPKPLRSSGRKRGAWSPSRILNGTMRSARETQRAKSTKIASPFGKAEALEVERARAWVCVAFAHCQRHDAERARDAAREVDEIASPFGKAEAFEVERARAWVCVAFAHCQRHDAERARDAAREVDEIASPFGKAEALEVERAQAWRMVAFAHSQRARCKRRDGRRAEKSTRSRARLARRKPLRSSGPRRGASSSLPVFRLAQDDNSGSTTPSWILSLQKIEGRPLTNPPHRSSPNPTPPSSPPADSP